LAQLLTQLCDGNDEDEIEEELEPRGASGFVLAERPQARRLTQTPDHVHVGARER